jgi:hypothetical protein
VAKLPLSFLLFFLAKRETEAKKESGSFATALQSDHFRGARL